MSEPNRSGSARTASAQPEPEGALAPDIGRGAKAILEVLLREDGPLTRQQLSERTGYSTTSSSFHAAIGELATLGLLERRGRGDGATLSAARVLVGAP